MIVVAVDARSRGRLRLRSADPRAKAAIDPAYLADEADLEVLVAGVRQAREIAARQPFAGLTAGEFAPGAPPADDERLRAWGPRQRHDDLPPHRQLRDGRLGGGGLRSRAAGPRRGGVAGGRRS
jgi:choline dehydrogenase-like flavoprotein